MCRAAFVACLTAVLGCGLAEAQEASDAQIRAAIGRGVQFLKAQQLPDGSWSYAGHELGITALVGLALVENGVPADDPVLRRAVSFVRGSASSNTFTYDISLAALFLARVGDPSDRQLTQQLGLRLLAGQLDTGGWTYVCPLEVSSGSPGGSVTNSRLGQDRRRRAGRLNAGGPSFGGFGDNSNTQFAVLGVWTAGREGLNTRDAMEQVERRFRTTQTSAGGWGYTGAGESDAMTCAGLMSLALAKGHKVLEGQMVNRRPAAREADGAAGRAKMESDAQIERGLRRMEFYANGIGPGSTLYFLWSVERVGVALGLSKFGGVDWYRRGASVLVRSQLPEGAWRSNRGHLPDTSFALLFLRRANLTEGVPQLVTGRTSESNENRMRAGKLEDLIRTVRPPAKPDP